MHYHREYTIHDEREQKRMALDTYSHDITNTYDFAIDKLIQELKNRILESRQRSDTRNTVEIENPELNGEREGADYHDSNTAYEQYQIFLEIQYTQEELLSLVEMKVIYACKSLEIHIKKLLGAAFSLKSTNEFTMGITW